MKFSLASIAAFASAVTAATLPPRFTLITDSGETVLTDGQYLYIGANITTHEIARFRSTPDTGAVTFTSTGSQTLFVVENDVAPVELTSPASGAIPDGASAVDFGVNEQGHFTHAGKDYFAVDGYGSNPEKTIYWYGSHSSTYEGVALWVKDSFFDNPPQ
ncbi:hypothetical protein BJY04DRAFT_212806 [Aspergillus karnatakaensis]|uniref:uncharacterized protein n=1 Tax=Aspergillus karnatakaensis TaxID=1810916 RepID=UPI003CCDFCE6